jgi:predicted phage terminase large subunit-like protein
MDHAVKSRDIIQSDKFRRFYPELKIRIDQNNKSYYKNTFGGERYATSVGGTITGKHAHILIVDDPINPKGAKSAALLKEANSFMDHTLSSRKVDKAVTPTILIMQRLSEGDPTQNMLDKEGKAIEHICLPAEDDGSVQPSEAVVNYTDGLLDPIRLSRKILTEAKSDLGSYDFAGQFMQRPAPAEGGLIKKDYFEIVDRLPYNTSTTNAYIDTAYTAKQENDPSGMLFCRTIENVLYVINYSDVRMEFNELCDHIAMKLDLYGSEQSRVKVEPKASGKSVVQYLRKQTKLNVIEYIMPEGDKVARTNANQPVFESGRVKLLKGSWNNAFLDAVAMFPNAKHDEAVDCLNMAVEDELKRPPARKKRTGYVDPSY